MGIVSFAIHVTCRCHSQSPNWLFWFSTTQAFFFHCFLWHKPCLKTTTHCKLPGQMSFSYKEYSRHDACSLPTPQDRLKADISDLRHRCNTVAPMGPCYAIVCSLTICLFHSEQGTRRKATIGTWNHGRANRIYCCSTLFRRDPR